MPRVYVGDDQEMALGSDKPVVFVLNRARNAELGKHLDRTSLLKSHGDSEVILSSSNSYSHGVSRMKLYEYIHTVVDVRVQAERADHLWYMFGHNEPREPWKSIIRDNYVRPPCGPVCLGSDATPTLGIGSSGSGTSFHFHGPAISEVIIGAKRWFLYPLHLKPDLKQRQNMSMATWVKTVLPSLPNRDLIFDCTISPGELLFFPSQFIHATLNVESYNVFVSLFI